MLTTRLRWNVSLALLGIITFIAGCSGGGNATPGDAADATPVAQTDAHDHDDHDDHEDGEHEHGGWWCPEHGVPESECTRCDSSLIAGFKEKGDWCDEHNVPESQCFKCDPSRAEPFIARYEAKYGKKPPGPTE